MKVSINMLRSLKASFILLLSIIGMLFTQCSNNKPERKNSNEQLYIKADTKKTSIVDLIANPKSHDKKLIQVKGFIHVEVENSSIYLSENDYIFGITKNSLWIDMTKSEMDRLSINDKYVIIEGIFDAGNKGHESNYSGAISNIKKLVIIKSYPNK